MAVLRRRIDTVEDFVRIEIKSTLRFGKHVIPALVPKADMPETESSTETLNGLERGVAVRLTKKRFEDDAKAITEASVDALVEAELARRRAESVAIEALCIVELKEAAKESQVAKA